MQFFITCLNDEARIISRIIPGSEKPSIRFIQDGQSPVFFFHEFVRRWITYNKMYYFWPCVHDRTMPMRE